MDCNHSCSTCKRVWNGGCILSPKRGIEYKITSLFKDEKNELHLEEEEEKKSGVYKITPKEMKRFAELGDKIFS